MFDFLPVMLGNTVRTPVMVVKVGSKMYYIGTFSKSKAVRVVRAELLQK